MNQEDPKAVAPTDRFDGLARGLFAAWTAHRLGITLAHARKHYAADADLGPYWTDLARRIETEVLAHMQNLIDGPDRDEETDTLVH